MRGEVTGACAIGLRIKPIAVSRNDVEARALTRVVGERAARHCAVGENVRRHRWSVAHERIRAAGCGVAAKRPKVNEKTRYAIVARLMRIANDGVVTASTSHRRETTRKQPTRARARAA